MSSQGLRKLRDPETQDASRVQSRRCLTTKREGDV
jgi:hypothetical protein